MKRLALALMLLMLSSAAQATTRHEDTITLLCKWSDDIVETFILDGKWMSAGYIHEGWTVKRITQRKYSIEVRVDGPKDETVWFDFNNGWPCRVETRRNLIQSESDSFKPAD